MLRSTGFVSQHNRFVQPLVLLHVHSLYYYMGVAAGTGARVGCIRIAVATLVSPGWLAGAPDRPCSTERRATVSV